MNYKEIERLVLNEYDGCAGVPLSFIGKQSGDWLALAQEAYAKQQRRKANDDMTIRLSMIHRIQQDQQARDTFINQLY